MDFNDTKEQAAAGAPAGRYSSAESMKSEFLKLHNFCQYMIIFKR